MMLAVRTRTLRDIASDPWWSRELEAAETTEQVFEVITAYCREKGLRVKYVAIKGAEKR